MHIQAWPAGYALCTGLLVFIFPFYIFSCQAHTLFYVIKPQYL